MANLTSASNQLLEKRMNGFVLADFPPQSGKVAFAQDQWTALINAVVIIAKAYGPLSGIE